MIASFLLVVVMGTIHQKRIQTDHVNDVVSNMP
jgi:hypothetical protein